MNACAAVLMNMNIKCQLIVSVNFKIYTTSLFLRQLKWCHWCKSFVTSFSAVPGPWLAPLFKIDIPFLNEIIVCLWITKAVCGILICPILVEYSVHFEVVGVQLINITLGSNNVPGKQQKWRKNGNATPLVTWNDSRQSIVNFSFMPTVLLKSRNVCRQVTRYILSGSQFIASYH